jgi:predicted glycoside hydrolase/deacetylase ChbG (UPF0249 family)
LCAVAAAILVCSLGSASAARPTLVERLGYPAGAKLLCVHGDDLGVAHSVDVASTKALESGLVSSASIMVPCPWFPEIAAYAKAHPDADFGLHLVLTSEWTPFKWGPVLHSDRVKSLIGPDGYLYPTEDVAASKIDPAEAESELRAQVDLAIASGVHPTHLDSHMGTLYQSKALMEAYVRVARDYKLPIRMSKEYFDRAPFMKEIVRPEEALFDHTIDAGPEVTPENWAKFYTDAIRAVGPGVTLVTIHLAYDDEEMRAVTAGHPDWGAAWRQRDYDYFTSDAFRTLLRENNITLVTYRELARAASR